MQFKVEQCFLQAVKEKKEPPVNCKAFPGEDMTDPLLTEWCVNNQHRKYCLGKCKLFPTKGGREVSIFQKNAE